MKACDCHRSVARAVPGVSSSLLFFPRVPAMPSRKRPIQQSSVKEQRLIEDVVRGKKGTATDALHRVNEPRHKHGITYADVIEEAALEHEPG